MNLEMLIYFHNDAETVLLIFGFFAVFVGIFSIPFILFFAERHSEKKNQNIKDKENK